MKTRILFIALALITVCFTPVEAQLGNALNKAKNAAKKVEKSPEVEPVEAKETNASAPATTATTATPATTTAERKTQPVNLLSDESVNLQMYVMKLNEADPASITELKKQLDARHEENLLINDAQAKKEIERFEDLITYCKRGSQNFAKSELTWTGGDGMQWSNVSIYCRRHKIEYKDNEPYFYLDGSLSPMDDNFYKQEVNYYTNLSALLYQPKIEGVKNQYEEFWKSRFYLVAIQKAQANTNKK